MFQFPTFASRRCGMTGLQPAGLPHSEISGSKRICRFPKLIAAYHVLHRLLMPRHPLCALLILTSRFFRSPRRKTWRPLYLGTKLCPTICNCKRTIPQSGKNRSFLGWLAMRSSSDMPRALLRASHSLALRRACFPLASARAKHGRGWNRTSDLILIRDAL